MGRAQKKAARRRPQISKAITTSLERLGETRTFPRPPEARIAKANETDEHHRPG